MDKNSIVAGVDIGGSHITAALVDLKNFTVLKGTYTRKSIDTGGASETIIRQWSSVINKAFNGYDHPKKIGIAMPGPFDYENGISLIRNQNKYDSLYGVDVRRLLAESLQMNETDILFKNDAACFLQGEALGGAAKGFNHVIGLTLGTGLGSAKCVHGVAHDADLWHSPFLDGIAEDYLSGRWLVKRFYEITGQTVENVKALTRLKSNDNPKAQVFKEFGKNLALFLSGLILSQKPQAVVLGGNISKAYALFYPQLSNNLPDTDYPCLLKKATLGENGNLVGAATCYL